MKKCLTHLLPLLLLLATLLSLVGCAKQTESDDFLTGRARELIEQSKSFNALFYEEGIPVDETGDAEGNYLPADATALAAYGYTKISDALVAMRGVWTQSYVERVQKSALFTAVAGTNGIAGYAYCYDKYDSAGNFVCVMVSQNGLPTRTDTVEYLYDTLTVTEKTDASARLTLTVRVTNDELETTETTLSVTLTKESDGVWRLGSSTAVAYPQSTYPLPA